ncbi:MAG: cation diffusion facilitator family transporter, partial [Planctomycetes bacterium]|nr:cation diffusion facilitator family transporter [Planctomycetota bacterium]
MLHNNIKGFRPVAFALIGNFFVTIIKFIAFFLTGSSALFSEAIHSVADTSNQALLMVGLRKSTKQPDDQFAYGYGRERFFWALISACGIFFLGAGVTLYHGFTSLFIEKNIIFEPIAFIVLAVSFVLETIPLLSAIKEIKKHSDGKSFSKALKNCDPSTLAVFYEDSVALLGILVAFSSLLLSQITGQHYWDAVGSIIIGSLLAVVAIMLIMKNRKFLLGHTVPDNIEERIIEILEADPAIEKVLEFKSNVLDFGVYLIKCDIEFNGNVLLKEMYKKDSLRHQYLEIKDDYEEFKKFCFNYADRLPRLIGKKIDEIEKV